MIPPSTASPFELVGVEKILFGSDYPLIAPQSDISKSWRPANCTDAEREQICGLNAEPSAW
ncbi:MAG: amidohydrolase [Desulfosudis oleivorans]|nr:amidohydrolase [Desulfosudis oleivorans]